METTTIIDPTSKKIREVRNLHITHHTVPNDETGKEESRKCVEFTVVGKNSEWNAYIFYEDFKENNENINI